MDKINYIDTFHGIIETVENSRIKSDVDPLLIASIGLVESHYNPDALSSKGAMGVFQFTNIAIKHIEQMGYS
ncbi:transglycosylase SLT domain-containing protein, partial [Mesotoga prima]|uniref:transglycosylase SLT domain-containing protein n=1 Tax=Mesotoga prima TaxID=1184387 RepID=UPI002FD8D2CA